MIASRTVLTYGVRKDSQRHEIHNSPLNALSRMDGIPLAEFILSGAEVLGDDVSVDKRRGERLLQPDLTIDLKA